MQTKRLAAPTAAVVLSTMISLTAQSRDPGTPLGCKAGVCSFLYVNSISLYGGDAQGLAIDPRGNLYIAENVNNLGLTPQGPFVVKVDLQGTQTVLVPAGVLGDVTALALDRLWNLYIADGNGYGGGQPASQNKIWRLTRDAQLDTFIQVNDPCGLAFDAEENLYVSSWSDGAVYKFSPAGRLLGTPLQGLGDASRPYAVAIDGAGNLYVAGYGTHYDSANRIFKVTPSGSVSVFVDPPVSNGSPASLVFDQAGNLYAGYYNSLQILRISPDGSYVVFPGGGIGPDAPNGMAIGRDHDLFVAVNGMRTTSLPAVVKLRGIVPR